MVPAPLASAIDWSSLAHLNGSFVDEELRDCHADLLFSAQLGDAEALIYFLFEHQSSPDTHLLFRMLRYIERIWAAFRRDHPERLYRVVLPCVLSNVADGWSAPTRLSDRLDADFRARPELIAHIPDFQLLLADLSQLSDEALKERTLSVFPFLALRLMRDARLDDRFLIKGYEDLVSALDAVYSAPNGREAFAQLVSYIYEVGQQETITRFHATISTQLPESEDILMTYAEKLRQQGLEKGLEQGLEKGLEQGLEQGLEEGRREGLQLGKRATLRRQLELKFGDLSPEVIAKLDAADEADVDRFVERIVSADSLDSVFGR